MFLRLSSPRIVLALAIFALSSVVCGAEPPAETAAGNRLNSEMNWAYDYAEAWHKANQDGKMLFIYFRPRQGEFSRQGFESTSLAKSVLSPLDSQFVWCCLPEDVKQVGAGGHQRLLAHSSFAEMQGRPGIAIIDLKNKQTRHFGQVVSTFPFPSGSYYGPRNLSVILGLPPGSLTQRTLTYAVRVHPESPASAWSQHSPLLASHAESHSQHQASINRQGHHNWDSRFQSISAQLPGGLMAKEVVAESWPGQDMMASAHECVNSWRQSDGHWNAVRSRHGLFAFDMKRGGNGIWYGTGLFGTHQR